MKNRILKENFNSQIKKYEGLKSEKVFVFFIKLKISNQMKYRWKKLGGGGRGRKYKCKEERREYQDGEIWLKEWVSFVC